MSYYIILYYVTLYITHDIDFVSCYYVQVLYKLNTWQGKPAPPHNKTTNNVASIILHRHSITTNNHPPPFSMGDKYIAQYMSSMVK